MRFCGRTLLRGKRFEGEPSWGVGGAGGAEPEKKGSGVCALPSLPEAAVVGSRVRVGGHTAALRVQARRGETWPKESDSGTFRNSRGLRVGLDPCASPGSWGMRVLARRRCRAGAGPPGGGSETSVWESQAHGWLSPGPPSPPQGPPFLDQVQAQAPRRAAHSPPPLYSAPPRLSLFLCLLPTTYFTPTPAPLLPPGRCLGAQAGLTCPTQTFQLSRAPAAGSPPAPCLRALCSRRPHGAGSVPSAGGATVVK